jgi:hypothetical protein
MERRRSLRANWTLAGLAGLVVLAGIILAVWKLPSLLYGDVTQASPDARLQAANGFRTPCSDGWPGRGRAPPALASWSRPPQPPVAAARPDCARLASGGDQGAVRWR